MNKKVEKIYEAIGVDYRAASILPELDYTVLLGVSVYCFNRCQSFIIELLRSQGIGLEWAILTDYTAGKLCPYIEQHIDDKEYVSPKLLGNYEVLCEQRNRIIHGFPVTDGETGEQRLSTKEKGKSGSQFPVNTQYMEEFIRQVTDFEYRLDEVRTLMREFGDYKL